MSKLLSAPEKKIAGPVQTRIKLMQLPVGLSTVETQTMILHSNSARSDITPLDVIIWQSAMDESSSKHNMEYIH